MRKKTENKYFVPYTELAEKLGINESIKKIILDDKNNEPRLIIIGEEAEVSIS